MEASDVEETGRDLYVSPISSPMATEKLNSKLLKLTKKLANLKLVNRGVKEVNKFFRKKGKGICVIAADVSPVDVVSHIPILCEKNDVVYCFIPSREELGVASMTKRPTSVVVLNKPPKDSKYLETYQKLEEVVRALNPHFS